MSNTIPMLASLLKPRDIKTETTYDVILKAHLEHKMDQLPQNMQDMLKRWRQANALMRDGGLVKRGDKEVTRPYTYTRLADYLVEEYKISYRTAYDDIANAKKFFLPALTKDDKDFARGVMIEWGEKFMFDAAESGDYKSVAALFKALAEVKGLLKDEQERPDYENINIPSFNLVADPSVLGFTKVDDPEAAVARILAKRKKSKIDQIISESENIEYTEENGN
jgi:hypothetical protein